MEQLSLCNCARVGLCRCGGDTDAALWCSHCDQLLSPEQSLNCGGLLAKWEKSFGVADWILLSSTILCPTVQKYARPIE